MIPLPTPTVDSENLRGLFSSQVSRSTDDAAFLPRSRKFCFKKLGQKSFKKKKDLYASLTYWLGKGLGCSTTRTRWRPREWPRQMRSAATPASEFRICWKQQSSGGDVGEAGISVFRLRRGGVSSDKPKIRATGVALQNAACSRRRRPAARLGEPLEKDKDPDWNLFDLI